MRCLQCGKDVPLLKRLAGNEFCSDAHRREYKEEYSKLALGRLLQSKPSEPVNHSLEVKHADAVTAPGSAPPAPIIGKPPAMAVLNGAASAAPNPTPARARAEVNGPATIRSTAKQEPKRAAPQPNRPQLQPVPVQPIKLAAQEPAVAVATKIQKPAPMALQMAVLVTAEFEQALTSLTPDQPRHHASMSPAELTQGQRLRMERPIEIADSAVHPVEGKLELRDLARLTPTIHLDLSIMAPESLSGQGQPLQVSRPAIVAPAEAALWTAAHRDFTNSVVLLGNFASFQLSTTGFEEFPPAESGRSATPKIENEPKWEAAPEPPAEPVSNRVEDPIPPAEFRPLPVSVPASAAAKAKPIQVFGYVHFNDAPVQVPQPNGLPLRPTMVLAARHAADSAPAGAVKKRDAGVRILPPATIKPSLPVARTPAAPAAEPDLGLPELRFQSSENTSASRMRKIMAAVVGVATLAIGGFLLLGHQSDAGSKPAVDAPARGDRWINNFATDAKQGRKVSVLRSSMGMSDYRLNFESSIQIKGLGWVYRVQDPKNFYVSKIELEKIGQNPKYVIAHYAVINGVEQPRAEAPLRVSVPLGGHYKIRFDAAGDRFTTWLQDQQVDQWTDTRLKNGGAGLYSEGIEQSDLHGDFQVTPLAKEK